MPRRCASFVRRQNLYLLAHNELWGLKKPPFSDSEVHEHNMQGSCASHPLHCLSVSCLLLTPPHLATALDLHNGPGEQGVHV
jgi:hypothetical protein